MKMNKNISIFLYVPEGYDDKVFVSQYFQKFSFLNGKTVLNNKEEIFIDLFDEKTLIVENLGLQYWAWKNTNLDYYGFFKSNALLSLSKEKFETNAQNWIWFYYLNDFAIDKLCLDKKSLESYTFESEFVVPEPYKISYKNIFEYHICDEFPLHNIEDLNTAYQILCELYPEDKIYADLFLYGKYVYPEYLFMASKNVFEKYSSWLFPIIYRLKDKMDLGKRSIEGISSIKDISGYLLGIYYLKLKEEGVHSCRVAQRAFIEKKQGVENIQPFFPEQSTAILLTSSDFYSPYCAVTIQSIISNSSINQKYDILILQQDLSETNTQFLTEMSRKHQNISIRFLDPRPFFFGFPEFEQIAQDFGTTRFPPILAYRAFSPYILCEYKKLIWIDCDLVFEHDIADLFSFDMKEKIIAFVHDIVICSFANGSDKTFGTYYTNAYIMKDIYQYGNAGVVVLDLEKFRGEIPIEVLLKKSMEFKHMIPEQDTINSILEGKSIFLDRRWNVVTFGSGPKWTQRFVPIDAYNEYLEAKKNPYVVHFVGPDKPWNNLITPMADRFWYYARKTVYYELILQRLLSKNQNKESQDNNDKRSWIRKIADIIIPPGTKRRNVIKKILPNKGSFLWQRAKKIYYSFQR